MRRTGRNRTGRTLTRAALLSLAAGIVGSLPASSEQTIERSPAPDGARVYIISPADGEMLKNPVTIRFGLSGMGVAPAGIDKKATGHHHLLIDVEIENPGVPIPSDDQHRHFGLGQTETRLELPPGKHTLHLVLGDYRHIPHDPLIGSKTITITVE